ncbi:MAG: hypothetical protein MUF49_28865, partial [Oculatellaceae cyanobacterium Prado106]|nr:hypothetical protein [Oculatellaceae cyanobacterium Prado106]
MDKHRSAKVFLSGASLRFIRKGEICLLIVSWIGRSHPTQNVWNPFSKSLTVNTVPPLLPTP